MMPTPVARAPVGQSPRAAHALAYGSHDADGRAGLAPPTRDIRGRRGASVDPALAPPRRDLSYPSPPRLALKLSPQELLQEQVQREILSLAQASIARER